MTTLGPTTPIGLAVIGCGSIGRIRAVLARNHPSVGWIGVCDVEEGRAKQLAEEVGAELYTTDVETLLARPEVNAVVMATSELAHVRPTLAAAEYGYPMLLEKPLATDVVESKQVLDAIQAKGIDAVMGYTQRFRRRYITIQERLRAGVVGEIDSVISRGLLNRLGPEAGLTRIPTDERQGWTPMNINGTHTVDLAMWFLGDKTPGEVYARSADRVLGSHGINNSTFGVVTMDDGTIWSMTLSVGLPVSWPALVYGLDIVVIGSEGAITVDDTHRDVVVATSQTHGWGVPQAGTAYEMPYERRVEFLTSYPPGDQAYGQTWGPMREETNSWFARITLGTGTPHATAADGHRNAVLTAAFDLSAKRGTPISWPPDLEEISQGLA